MKTTFKPILYVLGYFISFIIIALIGKIANEGTKSVIDTLSEKKVDKRELLNQLITEVNNKTQFPLIVDEATTLVRVYAEGDDVFVYEYELSAESIDVIANKPIIYERIKGNIGKTAKEMGISIVYTYKSKNTGKLIGVIRFDKNEL